jgi:hypothetical protein
MDIQTRIITNTKGLCITGNVGIGTESSPIEPIYPLHVLSSVQIPTYSPFYYWKQLAIESTTQYESSGIENVSIKATGAIWAKYYINDSDQRIKENIRDVSDNAALQQLRDISCSFYEYKDKISKGSSTTIGFIAQQVKEHMPMAVSIQKEIIPNEMRNIQNPQWAIIIDSSEKTYKLTIPDLEDTSGNTKYRFYVSNDPSGNGETRKEISSLEDDPKSFMFEDQWDNVFLYGKEVNDFHALDKQKLFALNFSATQEIDRIQQADKLRIAELEAKLAAIEARLLAAGI